MSPKPIASRTVSRNLFNDDAVTAANVHDSGRANSACLCVGLDHLPEDKLRHFPSSNASSQQRTTLAAAGKFGAQLSSAQVSRFENGAVAHFALPGTIERCGRFCHWEYLDHRLDAMAG